VNRILEAKLFADFRQLLEGWAEPVAFGVGFDGAVYAAARRPARRATSAHHDPLDYLVVRLRGREVHTLTLLDTSVHASYVQPCTEGVLLVDPRCQWRRRGPEQNAVIVDARGNVVRTFTLGDGIQDVRVTANGLVWVSYSDEGIAGSRGWSDPGPRAIGATGLVAFDSIGNVRFTYDAAAAGTDAIGDAYAMNVTGDGDVWIYFYKEFPIVRIHAGTYQRWKLGAEGARALAVRNGRVLLVGDNKQQSTGRVVAFDGDAARIAEELVITDGHGPVDDALVCGVGEKLYFFQDRQALALDSW